MIDRDAQYLLGIFAFLGMAGLAYVLAIAAATLL